MIELIFIFKANSRFKRLIPEIGWLQS